MKKNRSLSLFERLPERIFMRIHQDIGHASQCRAGILEIEKINEIALGLCHFIADEMDKIKEGKNE